MRLVTELACPDCDVTVHVLHESGAEIAASYGIKTVPAVVVDGRVVTCCDNRGSNREELAEAGMGWPL